MRETEIGSSHAGHQDVFNDTSIHSFPAERLPDGDWALWDRGPEPKYSESELDFIRDVQELAQVAPPGDPALDARPGEGQGVGHAGGGLRRGAVPEIPSD